MKLWKILIVISMLSLSGCFWNAKKDPVEVQCKPVERLPLNIKNPPPLELEPPNFIIITPENSEEKFQELESEGINTAIFGMTDDDYEKLSIAMAKIRAYIESLLGIVSTYRDYYEPTKNEN